MDEIYNLSPTKSYTAADILESVINPSSLSSTIQEVPNNLTRQNGSATSPEYYDVSSDDEPAHTSKIGNGIAGIQSAEQDGARKAESNSDPEIEEVKVIAETNNAPDLEFEEIEEIDEKDTPVVEKPADTVETVNNSDVDNAKTKGESAFDKYCNENIYEVEKVRENGKDVEEAESVIGKNHVYNADVEEVSEIVAAKIEDNGEVSEVKYVSDSGEAEVTAGEVAKENDSELLCEEMEVDKKVCEGDAVIGSTEVNVAEVDNNLNCYLQRPVDESTRMSVGMEVKSLAQLCSEAVGSTTVNSVDYSHDDIVPLAVECVIDEGVARGEDRSAVGDGVEMAGEKVDVIATQDGVEGGENKLKTEDNSQVENGDVLTADAAKVELGDSAVKTPKTKSALKRPATDSERKSSRKVSFTKIDSGWELAAKKPKRKSAGGASPKSVAAKSPAKSPSKKLTTPVKKVSQETTPMKDTWLKPFRESPNFYVGPVVLPVLQPVLTLDRIEKFFYKAMLVGKSSQVDRSPSYKASPSYNRSRSDDPPMEENGRSTQHMMGPASRRAEASSSRNVITGSASKKITTGLASKKMMAGPASKKVMAGPASKKVIAGPASKKVMAGPASKKVAAGSASKKVEAAPAPRKMIACPASRKAEFMARMASPPIEVGRSLRRRH